MTRPGLVAEDGSSFYLGDIRFDPRSCRLGPEGSEATLRPKAAAVLAALMDRAGEVVSKHELISSVWPDGFVGDGALMVCVNELRRAFGDDARHPRYIETAHRSGYRLLVEPSRARPRPLVRSPLFSGREHELSALWQWWREARGGHRTVSFVAAPAGVGKTALIEQWMATGSGRGGWLAGFGQSFESTVAGEAYQPVLDALDSLCRGPAGTVVVDVLQRTAPSWLAQLPGSVVAADYAAPPAPGRWSAPRMRREFAAAMREISAQRPVLLVLEDLHDADPSTIELLASLARGRDPARLMVVATYCPGEVVARRHPLHALVQDLCTRDSYRGLDLEPLTRDEVARTVSAVLAPRAPAPEFIDDVHARTEGNALFVTALCRHLAQAQLLSDGPHGVAAVGTLSALGVPVEVRAMLRRKVGTLGDEDRELLEVAAAAGREFTADALAAGLQSRLCVAEVEARCDRMAAAGEVVRAAGSSEWPDGTLTARYRFSHEMYQEVLYDGLGPARRAQVHRSIGERLQAAYGARAGEIATELAGHFDRAREFAAAAGHLASAARLALARSAYPEARDHVRRGLTDLDRLPAGPQRDQHELQLRAAEVVAVGAVWDWQDPAAYAGCLRLHQLAAESGDIPVLVAALLGEHNVAMTRGDAVARQACAIQLLELAETTGEPAARLVAHLLQIHLASRAGQCADMWQHAQRMLELHNPAEHGDLALLVGEEPSIAAHELGAVALWQLGHPDQAREHAAAALAGTRALEIPADLARALWYSAIVHMLRGDAAHVRELTGELDDIARGHELRLWRAGGAVLDGWATVWLGDAHAGLARLRDGMARWAQFAQIGSTFHASVAGDAYLSAGQPTDALAAVEVGLDAVAHGGEHQSEPELLRLRGELLRGDGQAAAAEQDLTHALDLVTQRQALGWRLRVATSLARLRRDQGRRSEAAALLGCVYDSFTEGLDTRDLRTASTLLAELRA